MKFKILAGFFVFGTLGAQAWADVAAPISAVMLYPGSATVVRTAQVAPGTTQIVVTGLPARFDPQTLRTEAGPGIRVGEIVTQDAARTEAVNPAEAELEAKIQTLQDQQAALDAEAKAAEIVKDYLESLGGGDGDSSKQPRPAMDAKTLAGVIDTLGRSAGETLAKSHRLAVQKREIGKKISALQRDLARLRTGSKDARTITVNVAADRAGTVKLSYQVPNAGWKPAYRAGLDAAASRVELERLATISQKSGEDWNSVKLTLSTAQPRQSPTAPDPQPWLLSYQPPLPPAEARAEKSAKIMMPSAAPAPARAIAGSGAEDYRPPTFETQSTFATEYEVPARVSLPADGREVSVALAKQTLPVKQYLRVAPRLDPSAVVTAEASRPQGVWLTGNLQLFRDGNYVGATHWNPQSAERFVFSFGRDELLRVTVDQVKGKSGTTGIFDRRQERRMADVFTLTSAHRKPVDVLVLEASPVSASDEIKVQASFEPQPTIDPWEQRRGVVAWEKTLAPGETARFGVDYTIEYPKEGSVSGLR
ncbi:MAG: mucoidy inhibitor MuiA family protein [Rhodocyclaceae bacterium]|nr:mucoidy inhibitor MuiA family protein [Rhodocyclaceae bacterium]